MLDGLLEGIEAARAAFGVTCRLIADIGRDGTAETAVEGVAGLHRTAHASEDAPARNVATCLDLLGCERIDHGYHVRGDERVLARARDAGVCFTVCPTATAVCYFTPDLAQHPIVEMVERGLSVVIGSDDPPMFGTDIGAEFVRMCTAAGWDAETVRELCLNGVDAAWLDDDERRDLRRTFERELANLKLALHPRPRRACERSP